MINRRITILSQLATLGVLLILLLTIGSCLNNGGSDPPPPTNNARVQVVGLPQFKEVNQTYLKKVSLIPGFEHQYDTCVLTVYKYEVVNGINKWNPIGEWIDPQGPQWGNVGVSAGYYTFTGSNKNPAPSYSYYMDFSGSLDSVNIQPGLNQLTIPIQSSQALILIDKSLVDGAPLLQGTNNETGVMSTYGNYYYIYVKQGLQTAIRYTIDGQESMIAVFPYKQKIYTLVASQADVIVTDPFTEVIEI